MRYIEVSLDQVESLEVTIWISYDVVEDRVLSSFIHLLILPSNLHVKVS